MHCTISCALRLTMALHCTVQEKLLLCVTSPYHYYYARSPKTKVASCTCSLQLNSRHQRSRFRHILDVYDSWLIRSTMYIANLPVTTFVSVYTSLCSNAKSGNLISQVYIKNRTVVDKPRMCRQQLETTSTLNGLHNN